MKQPTPARTLRTKEPGTGDGRQVADCAHRHRAEQDSGSRLPARRADGTPDVRRGDLPAADGRVSHAGDRPADGGHARVVHRPRRDAALDARGPKHGHGRGAAACLCRCRSPRIWPVSRRRLESCMQFLDTGLELVRSGKSSGRAAEIVARCQAAGESVPGFGHWYHTRDPRAARLFQMALELEIEGGHIQLIRSVEMLLGSEQATNQPCRSTSMAPSQRCAATWACRPTWPTRSSSSRACPGSRRRPRKSASASTRCARSIPKDHIYDGPSERRLPDGADSATANVRVRRLPVIRKNTDYTDEHGQTRTCRADRNLIEAEINGRQLVVALLRLGTSIGSDRPCRSIRESRP